VAQDRGQFQGWCQGSMLIRKIRDRARETLIPLRPVFDLNPPGDYANVIHCENDTLHYLSFSPLPCRPLGRILAGLGACLSGRYRDERVGLGRLAVVGCQDRLVSICKRGWNDDVELEFAGGDQTGEGDGRGSAAHADCRQRRQSSRLSDRSARHRRACRSEAVSVEDNGFARGRGSARARIEGRWADEAAIEVRGGDIWSSVEDEKRRRGSKCLETELGSQHARRPESGIDRQDRGKSQTRRGDCR
jgi:hypothetical protein